MSRCRAKPRSAHEVRGHERAASGVEGEKAELLQQRVEVMKKATELRAKRDKYLSDRIAESSTETIASVQNALDDFDIKIRQIHVKDVDLVDRCESCHLGHARAGHADEGCDGRRGGIHQPSEQGTAEDPRSRRSSAARRATAATARRCRAWRRRTGTTNSGCGRCTTRKTSRPDASSATRGDRHRDGGHAEPGPRDFPAARLHGLPPLRGLRPRSRRDVRRQPAICAAGAAEGRVDPRGGFQRAEGR